MENLQYVGFWSRFWAVVIDTIILMMIIYPIFYFIYGDSFMARASELTFLNNIINFILPSIAILILWYYKSATPGKMLLKAIIVDADTYKKPSMKQFIIRNISYIISFLPLGLGYIWAGWDSKKQAWHDKLANTLVVQPKTEQKSKGIGTYLAIAFGTLAIVVLASLMAIGLVSQAGLIPDPTLYNAKKLKPSVTVKLLEKGILQSGDILNYFQPDSVFSFTDTGTIFTDSGIIYFETDDNDEVLLWDFPFRDISKLTFDTESVVMSMEIIAMTLYGENGDVDFTIGITPLKSDAKRFKKEIMELWRKARKY